MINFIITIIALAFVSIVAYHLGKKAGARSTTAGKTNLKDGAMPKRNSL
jgi:hypothetical protein